MVCLQKYRLYLKRVAGVQVQPPGRGRGSHNGSLDSQQTFGAPLVMPGGQLGLGGGPPGLAPLGSTSNDSLSDQEQLKVQLQMQQMQTQQAAGMSDHPQGAVQQSVYCKQEVRLGTFTKV